MPRKKLKMIVRAVEFMCPHCEAPIMHPGTGSYLWYLDDLTETDKITCPICTRSFELSTDTKKYL